jgi:hypothetical protein
MVSALAAMGPSLAQADTVTLSNGDRLTGTVLEMTRGKLRFETEHSGKLEIKWSEIVSLTTDRFVHVEFFDKEPLNGKVILKDGLFEIWRDPLIPPTQVSPSEVSGIDPAGIRWSASLTLALRAEDGNNHSTDIFTNAELIRESDVDKTLLRGYLIYGTEDRAATDQSAYGLLQYNYRIGPDWYLYGGAECRTDRFEDLTLRAVFSLGPGFILVKKNDLEAWIDAGPSYTHEVLRTGEEDDWFGARVAAHVQLKLSFGLDIRDDFAYYPNFKDPANWQIHNEGTLSTPLGSHWSLTLNIITDLDHEPIPGKRKYDDVYALGVRFSF